MATFADEWDPALSARRPGRRRWLTAPAGACSAPRWGVDRPRGPGPDVVVSPGNRPADLPAAGIATPAPGPRPPPGPGPWAAGRHPGPRRHPAAPARPSPRRTAGAGPG